MRIDESQLPLHVDSNGDLIYTNPSGVGQIVATSSELPHIKSYSFESFPAGSGVNYIAGFYDLTSADVNLNQGALTSTLGTANFTYAAHAILVSKQNGTVGGGASGVGLITLSGTSISDSGIRSAGAVEIIVADTTTAGSNKYFESAKKWIGQVVYTLSQDGDRTTYAFDFNYGFAKYEDFGNRDATIVNFEVVGLGGATDTAFDVALMVHESDNWLYHATTFVAPATANDLTRMTTVHNTETNLSSGEGFAFKRTGLSQLITGSANAPASGTPNGVIIQITTGQNGAVQAMDAHIGFLIA